MRLRRWTIRVRRAALSSVGINALSDVMVGEYLDTELAHSPIASAIDLSA